MPRRTQGAVRRSLSSLRRWLQDAKRAGLVEVDSDRLEEVLRRAEQTLDEKDAALVRAVFESYAYVTELVEDKNTSIRRLRQLLFGARTEKTDSVVGHKAEKPDATAPRDAAADADPTAGEGNTDEADATAGWTDHGVGQRHQAGQEAAERLTGSTSAGTTTSQRDRNTPWHA